MSTTKPTTRSWLERHAKKYTELEKLVRTCCVTTSSSRKNVLEKLNDLKKCGYKFTEKLAAELVLHSNPTIMDRTPIELSQRNQIAQLQNTIQILKSESGTLELFLEDISKNIKRVEPIAPLKFDESVKVSSPISAVLVLSDWHLGEVIFKNQTESTNEFNLVIAKKRLTYLIEKFIEWTLLHKSNYIIDELVVIPLGDLISGDLHYELTATNEVTVPQQTIKAAQLLSYVVSSLSPYFNKVRIEFNCVDNHSRLTKKLQYKNAAVNSFNIIIAEMTKAYLENVKNVQFAIHNDIKNLVAIKKNNYLIGHGSHFCKAWMGIPFYGIKRMTGEEAKFRMHHPGTEFKKVIMGHYHTPGNLPDVIMNGSLSGTSEFDIGQGRYSPPCQVGFFVHPKFGDFDYSVFFLDKVY